MQTKSESSQGSDPGSGTSSEEESQDLPGTETETEDEQQQASDETPTPKGAKPKTKDASEQITPEAFAALREMVNATSEQLRSLVAAVAGGTSTAPADVQAAVREALLSKEHAEAHERLEKGLSERGEQRPRSGLAELFLGKRA